MEKVSTDTPMGICNKMYFILAIRESIKMIKERGKVIWNISTVICNLSIYLVMMENIEMILKKEKAIINILTGICNRIYWFSYDGDYKNDIKDGNGILYY